MYEDNLFTLNLKITNTVVLYKIVSNKTRLSDRIFTIIFLQYFILYLLWGIHKGDFFIFVHHLAEEYVTYFCTKKVGHPPLPS